MSERIIQVTIHHGTISKTSSLELSKINKERLIKLVRKELGFNKSTSFKLTRKSKRSKKYVPLVDHGDFKALGRSLDVKNHLKLKIEDVVEKEKEKDEKDDDKDEFEFKQKEYDYLVTRINEMKESIDQFKQKINEKTPIPNDHQRPDLVSIPTRIQNISSNVIHPTIYCDVCNPFDDYNGRIKGTRYQCRDCFNYDLCESCYVQGKFSGDHLKTHSMNKISIIPKDCFVGEQVDENEDVETVESVETAEEKGDEKGDDPNAIYLDINVDPIDSKEYESKIVEFVSKYNDVSKLSKILSKIQTYDHLLSLTDNDEVLLSTMVESFIESNKNQSIENKSSISKKPNLSIEISQIDQTLIFHLQNKSSLLTPKNLTLVMKIVNKHEGEGDIDNVTKFNLSIGPHSIYPNGHKRLYYNLNGIYESNFKLFDNKFTIELFDEFNKLFALGICINGSGLVELNDDLNVLEKLSNIDIDDKDEDEIDEDGSSEQILQQTNSNSNSNSNSDSNSSSSQFVTPSNSTFITDQIFQSKEDLIDIESKTDSLESTETADSASTTESPKSSINPRSSTSTLTPEFLEVDDNLDAIDAVVSTDLSDDEVDDNDSFTEDYEVLSTDDYSE
ncbi:Transcriptional adapter 2 [Wickerhamomyces ciferrii]|uniref:Transcriptional adapter 2 n=1 Tax=Wickerhamomyces ciferrii (strain ATCC 14091 / BCRC 22168 / CBS 111 / JCM 3599 / NBRC 0793 / NRRL Y-1031 F-60-10) TaxID=1206466 RepID=K0KQT3_WICCF|nr:Transcriptional adapter 2 [Wickerhamomyces ciferrii]CCH45451.1 Transcriptional adapter 2 [Wickerhamomyces ciferrii]